MHKNTPKHYALDPEPIDVIRKWNLNFALGNAIKYIARAGLKDGESKESDLLKARDYIDDELGIREKTNAVPNGM